jgi:SAM-dependent methyltransferase
VQKSPPLKPEKPFSFDQTYLDYYQERLDKASDGTRIPDLEAIAALVKRMNIRRGERVLDVGCSFGRLLPILSPLTDAVFGLELSYDVVDVAARNGYQCVVRGGAEDSNLPSAFFSHVILFGVFDCCDQPKALRETRRLLSPNGKALLTGKNANYHDNDTLALVAERNAWQKSFPNSFTLASQLALLLPGYGLDLVELLRFARRGDFGEMRPLPASAADETPFYEFAAIVKATDGLTRAEAELSVRISHTARRVARMRSFASVEEFFGSTSLDHSAT